MAGRGHAILGGQRCPGPVPGHGDEEEEEKLRHPRLFLPRGEQGPLPQASTHGRARASPQAPVPPSPSCSCHCQVTPRHKQSHFYLKKETNWGRKANKPTNPRNTATDNATFTRAGVTSPSKHPSKVQRGVLQAQGSFPNTQGTPLPLRETQRQSWPGNPAVRSPTLSPCWKSPRL